MGHQEVVVASLKILLVLATRLKGIPESGGMLRPHDHRHPLLAQLTELLEQHYRRLHAPAEYASLLHMTPKALARVARTQFGKTVTELVRERLLIDAKWDLLHTLKPVKEIAGELGFSDELYFVASSRRPRADRPRPSATSKPRSAAAAICPCLWPVRPFPCRAPPAEDIPQRGISAMTAQTLFERAAALDHIAVAALRLGLIVVLLWIGGLKAAKYEADGITPFVANSPFMSFFYAHPGEYAQHRNPEGALVPANRAWHQENGTYRFALGLGAVIVLYGLLIALHPWLPEVATVGSALVFLMSLVTLSFLVTTPEAWVPNLGDAAHGFPYLSGAGRLVIKDAIMMGAALVTMADSARAYLRRAGSGRAAAPAASRAA